MKTIEIESHTIEIKMSSTGSIDPWSSKWADENSLPIMCTSDLAKFILIDGEEIYRLDTWNTDFLSSGLTKFSEVLEWLEGRTTYFGKLSESIRCLEKRKKKQIEWQKLTPEQRKRRMENRRKEKIIKKTP